MRAIDHGSHGEIREAVRALCAGFLRDDVGATFGGIEVAEMALSEGADGRRFLVIHADPFDTVVRHSPWLTHPGDGACTAALDI